MLPRNLSPNIASSGYIFLHVLLLVRLLAWWWELESFFKPPSGENEGFWLSFFFPISSWHKNPCWQGHSHSIVPLVIFIKYSCFDVVCVCCSQNGLATKVEKSRKQMKERRNRAKKIRGVKKVMFSLMVTIHCFLCVTVDLYSYNQD
jgi:hypothetical protein